MEVTMTTFISPIPPDGGSIVIGAPDAQFLALIAGVILSLIFSYVPGLSVRFDALKREYKRLAMLVLLAMISAVLYGGICAGVFVAEGVVCGSGGLLIVVKLFVQAAVANQTAYSLAGKK
jgi:hypothetical protein